MLKIGIQYFGGRGGGGSAGGRGGSRAGGGTPKLGDKGIISEEQAEKLAREQLRAGPGEYASVVDEVKITGPVDSDGMADVKIDYHTTYYIDYGGGEGGYEEEYKVHKTRMKVKK